VYGACRPLVNLLLFAAAKSADASLHWLEIGTARDAVVGPDPARLDWIDAHHHWTVDASEAFRLDHARANAALFELVRADEPPETLARLADFLRLPSPIQRILSEGPTSERPAVIAVANADRTADAFPAASLPHILDALSWAGFSLFVGYCGDAPATRSCFRTVLRIDGESVERWDEARLTIESAPGGDPLRRGAAVRLGDLPFAADVLRRATGLP
jgi:hypothetical protein